MVYGVSTMYMHVIPRRATDLPQKYGCHVHSDFAISVFRFGKMYSDKPGNSNMNEDL